MKQITSLSCLIAGSFVHGLHVTQWQDSLTVFSNEYILFDNSNVQNFFAAAVDSKTQL